MFAQSVITKRFRRLNIPSTSWSPLALIFALTLTVGALTIFGVSARSWWVNGRVKAITAEKSTLAPPQQTPTPVPRDPSYARRARLRPQLREALSVLGDRLETLGKERLTMIGTLKRSGSQAALPFRLITELPNRLRLEERAGAELRVIGFDGNAGWALGSTFDSSHQDLIEALVFEVALHSIVE